MAELVRVGGSDLYGPFYECSDGFQHYTLLGGHSELGIPEIKVNPGRPLAPYLRRLIGRMTVDDSSDHNPPLETTERINLLYPDSDELDADIESIAIGDFDFFVRAGSSEDYQRFSYRNVSNIGNKRLVFFNNKKISKRTKVRDIFPGAEELILEYVATPDAPTPKEFKDDGKIVDEWHENYEKELIEGINSDLKERLSGLEALANADLLTWRILSVMESYDPCDADDYIYPYNIIDDLAEDGCVCPCQSDDLAEQDIFYKLVSLEKKEFLRSNDEGGFLINEKKVLVEDN
ncbi:hypothetical protein KY332_01515 [Candidatus Woesearchaeota archaeon]|nr:hypothetical protein [Candidatus Woesearchaeota archaeon]